MAIIYPEMSLHYASGNTAYHLARVAAAHAAGCSRYVRLLDMGSHAGHFLCDFIKLPVHARFTIEGVAIEPDEHEFGGLCTAVAKSGVHIRPLNIGVEQVAEQLRDEAFDLVLANHSIYYFTDWPEQLSLLRERLVDGGLLLVTVDSLASQFYEAVVALRKELRGRGPGPGFITAEEIAVCLETEAVPYAMIPVASILTWTSRSNLIDLLAFFGRLSRDEVAEALERMPAPRALFEQGSAAGFVETIVTIAR